MKNRIWVTKLTRERATQSEKYAFAFNGKPESVNRCSSMWSYLGCDPFNTGVQEGELFEIIIDTETQKYEVKRQREIGWYLVECKSVEDDGLIFACHWNGENWNPIRNKNKWRKGTTWKGLDENEVTVHSEKLPCNEYLKSLE